MTANNPDQNTVIINTGDPLHPPQGEIPTDITVVNDTHQPESFVIEPKRFPSLNRMMATSMLAALALGGMGDMSFNSPQPNRNGTIHINRDGNNARPGRPGKTSKRRRRRERGRRKAGGEA